MNSVHGTIEYPKLDPIHQQSLYRAKSRRAELWLALLLLGLGATGILVLIKMIGG